MYPINIDFSKKTAEVMQLDIFLDVTNCNSCVHIKGRQVMALVFETQDSSYMLISCHINFISMMWHLYVIKRCLIENKTLIRPIKLLLWSLH